LSAGDVMNTELEAYIAAARTAPVRPPEDSEARQRERADFPARFLDKADVLLKPGLDSTAETLRKHGYGAMVEMVRDQSGADPNTFPYVTLHFSAVRCAPSDLGYIYTLAGASITFICRRDDLCVEVLTAHPAGPGRERRVNFCTLALKDLAPERVSRLVTDAVKQIIRL
jgi:hypothetical protein